MVALGLVLILAIAIALLARRWDARRRRGRYDNERERMPAELRQAPLVASEQLLRSRGAYPFHGRTDQVYRVNGLLVPVETKTRRRPRIYLSDVVQLSIQAVMLAEAPAALTRGAAPATYGYIRFRHQDNSVYRRVELLRPEVLYRWHDRFWAVRVGERAPQITHFPAMCFSCPHQDRCSQATRTGQKSPEARQRRAKPRHSRQLSHHAPRRATAR